MPRIRHCALIRRVYHWLPKGTASVRWRDFELLLALYWDQLPSDGAGCGVSKRGKRGWVGSGVFMGQLGADAEHVRIQGAASHEVGFPSQRRRRASVVLAG